jgi:phosphatidylserine/phosphatidylglycerophosphate/cardiolipin synthase-like enzyme
MNATEWVAEHLRASPHALAAVSAALWGLVGRPVTLDDLQWARRLMGDEGPLMLHNTLRATGVLKCMPPIIRPQALAALIASWTRATPMPVVCTTVPVWLSRHTLVAPTIRDVLNDLITSATEEVLLCSPYMDAEGIGLLLEALRTAIARGARLSVMTHHLDEPHSPNARAVTLLRREIAPVEAISFPSLVVTADGNTEPLLVHTKLVMVDQHTAWVGSANLTKAGLLSNVELGVLLPDVGAYGRNALAAFFTLMHEDYPTGGGR